MRLKIFLQIAKQARVQDTRIGKTKIYKFKFEAEAVSKFKPVNKSNVSPSMENADIIHPVVDIK